MKNHKIVSTTYDESNGIGNLIRQKQKQLRQSVKKDGEDDLVFLIKPARLSTYKNVIDALDETTINGVKKYMIIDPSLEEDRFVRE